MIKRTKKKQREEFSNILHFAKKIFEENPAGLPNLIRLLGRNAQYKYLTYIIRHTNAHEMGEISPSTHWFDPLHRVGKDEIPLHNLFIEIIEPREVKLSRDLVLTNPWNRQRMEQAFIEHGEGRKRGPWRQDSNHFVQLWLPVNISWVGNGYHSIAAGIIQGDGIVIPNAVYNISKIYDYIKCDGEYFIDIHNDKPISKVVDVAFSSIFEIGRLLI